MEYIRRVKSNIKGGVDVELGPRTVLVGPNGSGKSSIVQAIQVAADGAVRDGEGRDRVKEYGALARFFPAQTKTLFSTLTLSDDTGRHWEIKKSGKTWKQGKGSADFDVYFPFEEVKAVLSQGDKEVRAWLSDQILGRIEIETLEAILPEDQFALVTRLVREQGCELDFNVIAAAAKKKATSIRRMATVKEKTVDQLTEGVRTPLTPSQKAALDTRAAELNTVLSSTHEKTLAGKEALLSRIDQKKVSLLNVMGNLRGLASSGDGGLSAEELMLVKQLQQLLLLHVKHFGAENCMVCRSKGIEEALSEQVQIVEAGLRAGSTAQKKMNLEAARDSLSTDIDALQAEYDSYVVKDLAPLRTELSEIRDVMAGDIAARRAWDNVKAVNAEVSGLRGDADALVAAADTLQKVGMRRLKEGLTQFTEAVGDFCPDGVEVGVDLAAGRVGFVRDGQLHTALSGGEWSALVMALGCYLTRAAPSEAISVLTPDDRGWDPITLSRVMRAVQDYPGQVLIMSTVAPEEWEDGWRVIGVDADE